MSLTEEDRKRRRSAKRYNERLKLSATGINAVSIAVTSVAIVLPALATPDLLLAPRSWILLCAAGILHLMAQLILGFLRSED